MLAPAIYKDLNIPNYVPLFFEDHGIVTDEEICLSLEAYRYVEREVLCDYLTKRINIKVVNISVKDYSPSLDLELSSIAARFGVLIDSPTSLQVRVLSSPFNASQADNSLVSINQSRADVVYVTPLNFLELSGVSFDNWNFPLLFCRLIQEGVKLKATDLHVYVVHDDNKKPVYKVGYRVSGVRVESELFRFNEKINRELITKIIHTRSEAVAKDLSTIYGVITSIPDVFRDGDTSVRLVADKVHNGYRAVCRIQNISTVSLNVDELGFPDDIQEDLKYAVRQEYGLTLICGPINTGKNTTLFAMTNELKDDNTKNIVDYSSPIEVLMWYTQVDYNSNIDLLREKIRLAKKQDVNIVLLNEIPDSGVATEVLNLVNSSVHVMTTTHVPRLWRIPYKLREFYGKEYKSVIAQLNFLAVQKMTVKSCVKCRREASLESLKPSHRKMMESYGHYKHYINDGCEDCDFVGHIGKLQPFMERLVLDDNIISRLLEVEMPYEMERILKNELFERKQTLEYQITNAVSSGSISAIYLNLL